MKYLEQVYIPSTRKKCRVKMDPKLEEIVSPQDRFDDGAYASRTQILKEIVKYIKDNKLNNGVRINFDDRLLNIFGSYDEPITFITLQKYIHPLITYPIYPGECHTCYRTKLKCPIKQGPFFYCSEECYFTM